MTMMMMTTIIVIIIIRRRIIYSHTLSGDDKRRKATESVGPPFPGNQNLLIWLPDFEKRIRSLLMVHSVIHYVSVAM
jgi:hypothetical protein